MTADRKRPGARPNLRKIARLKALMTRGRTQAEAARHIGISKQAASVMLERDRKRRERT